MTRRHVAAAVGAAVVLAVVGSLVLALVADSAAGLTTARTVWLLIGLLILAGASAVVAGMILFAVRSAANRAASGARAAGRLEDRLALELDTRALEVVEAVEAMVAEFRRAEQASVEDRAATEEELASRMAEISKQLRGIRTSLAEIQALQDPGGDVVPHPNLRRKGHS